MNGKDRIKSALRREPVDRPPVWFMRQAGRHLPEYRAISKETTFMERCMDLDLCLEVTTQPLNRYPQIDAAIVFSDILTPLPGLGYEVEFGGGIRIDAFEWDDLDNWGSFNSRAHAPWAANALRALEDHVEREVARLGFVGCPWTVAMYLIAGGTGDKDFHQTRALIHSNPKSAKELLDKLAVVVGDLLADQANHGKADAVQMFDTWAGMLSNQDYRDIVLPATKKAIDVFRKKCDKFVPLIHYARGSGHLHNEMRTLDIQAMSLDWRDNLAENRRLYGEKFCFQGNLDPARMHGSVEAAKSAARRVLAEAGDSPGHIFNLGHGFSPGAKIDCVEAVLRVVEGKR